jgi:hypothetical protein
MRLYTPRAMHHKHPNRVPRPAELLHLSPKPGGGHVVRFSRRFALPSGYQLSSNDYPALGEADLFADLSVQIPACPLQRWRDELAANIAFAEFPLIHGNIVFS